MPHRAIARTVSLLLADLEAALAGSAKRPFVLGIAGAQGSGKSTLARALSEHLNAVGRRAAHLSLDDFYLGRAARRAVAARLHPLFVTRGPPGTHDVEKALALFSDIRSGSETIASVFDKASDEPLPPAERRVLPPNLDVLVFEGWCLGATPQSAPALYRPINMLERTFDADGTWRRAVNKALAGAYQTLFAEIDRLVFLRAPSFAVVRRWRSEQERALRATGDSPREMSSEEIAFFIQHFERLTRWQLEDLPRRAHFTLQLDDRRRVTGVVERSGQRRAISTITS